MNSLTFPPTLETLIFLAGVGQLVLVVGSLAIPGALNWRADVAQLRPLTRQVFWTYAAYILCTNLCFGLISTLAPRWLIDRSPLAGAVTAFMAVYWGARIIIQFAYFDRSDAPRGPVFLMAEAALVCLFLFLTLTYGAASVINFRGRVF